MTFATDTNSSSVGFTLQMGKDQVPKYVASIAGYYMIVVCILGIIENLVVLNTFRRNPKLRFVSTYMVRILCVYNITTCVCAFPFIFVSCIYNKWIFSEAACQWYGFAVTTLGLGSISSLTCNSFERFVVIIGIKKDSPNKQNTPMKMSAIVCFCIGLAIGLLPCFGIGTYKHEPIFLSCSPAWSSKSKEDFVFIMLIFACAFILPLCINTLAYVGICIKACTRTTNITQRRIDLNIKLAVMSFLMIAGFLLSWTPYAVFALLRAFTAKPELTAMENIIPVMMAKSCVLWDPLICVVGSEEFRKALKKDVYVMLSCISNRCIIKCRSGTNRNENEHIDTRAIDYAMRDNHVANSDANRKKRAHMFKVDQNESSESSLIWVRNQENNNFKCESVKTYSFEIMQCESCV